MSKWTSAALIAVVLAVVFAILFPIFRQSHDEDPRIRALYANLNGLQKALSFYVEDNNGYLPPMQDTEIVKRSLMSYARITEYPSGKTWLPFIDPTSHQPYQPNPFLSGKKLKSIPPSTIAFYLPDVARSAFRFAFIVTLEGHLHEIEEHDWPAAKRASHIP